MFYNHCIVILLFAVIQVLPARGLECKCGRPSDAIVSMRIVGGRRAEPHSFPWTVAIKKQGRMHCGGSVITTKHVLSAGHCFKWDDYNTMTVLIGLDSMDNLENVEQRKISGVVIHEDFKSSAVRDENDIAVVTLRTPVVFNDIIMPVCLPKPNEDFAERVGTIVGWGRMGVDQLSSRVLLRASLGILSDETCMRSQLAEHLKPTMMCAFSKGRDGCQGDSGGPFVVFQPEGRYVQAGIVSWGIGCANPKYPDITTQVLEVLGSFLLEYELYGYGLGVSSFVCTVPTSDIHVRGDPSWILKVCNGGHLSGGGCGCRCRGAEHELRGTGG